MKKPRFFIIGSPKYGTTSLAARLAEHPHIYMSPAKEPHHFNSDANHIVFENRHEYEWSLNIQRRVGFLGAIDRRNIRRRPGQLAIGPGVIAASKKHVVSL